MGNKLIKSFEDIVKNTGEFIGKVTHKYSLAISLVIVSFFMLAASDFFYNSINSDDDSCGYVCEMNKIVLAMVILAFVVATVKALVKGSLNEHTRFWTQAFAIIASTIGMIAIAGFVFHGMYWIGYIMNNVL